MIYVWVEGGVLNHKFSILAVNDYNNTIQLKFNCRYLLLKILFDVNWQSFKSKASLVFVVISEEGFMNFILDNSSA